MRWHLRIGVSLLLAFLGAGRGFFDHPFAAAQQLPDASVSVRPSPPAFPGQSPIDPAQPLPQQWPAATDVQDPSTRQLAADPFHYRVPEGTGGFAPSTSIEMPAGIRVLGILMLDAEHSLAALQLPGDNEVFYVREGDDVQVAMGGRGSSAVRRPPAAPAGKSPGTAKSPSLPRAPAASLSGNVFYLKIKKISADHVEVYPQSNPTNIHVYR